MTDAILDRCFLRFANWIKLIKLVVKSEFPEFEAMAAFSALHLTKGQHTNAAMVGNQLAHLAHLAQVSEHELASQFDNHINRALFHAAEGKSAADAWRLALGCGCDDGALREVVARLIAFSCSTSGVEQLFARIHATVRPQRGCMDEGHTRDCISRTVRLTAHITASQ